jgi:hypothetical protein
MTILIAKGVNFPSPTSLEWGIQDIVKADRNTKGNIVVDWINTKRKLMVNYAFLTQEQCALVLSTLQATKSTFLFPVTYTDPLLNAVVSNKKFYAGDRTGAVMDVRNGVIRYKDIKFDLIEE